MVRPPHLDHAIEAAFLEAAQEVAQVRCKVGRLSVRTDDYAVLVFGQHLLAQAVLLLQRRTEPDRAIAILQVARFAQPVDGSVCESCLPHPRLPEPLVVMDVQPGDRSEEHTSELQSQ